MTRSCPACSATLEPGAMFCGECGRVAGGTVALRDAGSARPDASRRESLVEPPVAERVTAPIADRPPARDTGRPSTPRPSLLPVPSLPEREPTGSGPDELIDLESTVLSGAAAPAFVLQFSTGESVRVRGDGLIGRGPVREPGEVVDQLIALADAGRSVSKTHVQFGQDRGRFWISDRFSTNGTVVRPPDEPPRRCEPGRRYLVSRGSRVDIGDQFFVVS